MTTAHPRHTVDVMTEHEQRRRFAQELATLIDDESGPDGMWSAGDLIQAIARFIGDNGGWSVCDNDGLIYASNKKACPYCP